MKSWGEHISIVSATMAGWLAVFAPVSGDGGLGKVLPWIAFLLAGVALWRLFAAGQRVANRGLMTVAILCVIAAALCTFPPRRDADDLESAWRDRQTRQIQQAIAAIGDRVAELQAISSGIGERSAEMLGVAAADPVGWRLEAFRVLGDQARAIAEGGRLPAGTEIGIQLFEADGTRAAWAGWPQPSGEREGRAVVAGREMIYTRQVSLYRILTHVIPLHGPDGGRVGAMLVDLPLEVNYKVNNRFLKSSSLAAAIPTAAADIRFDYYPEPTLVGTGDDRRTPSRQPPPGDGTRDETDESRSNLEPMAEVAGDPAFGLVGRSVVLSDLGSPLMTVTVTGRPLRFSVQARADRYEVLGNTLLLVALTLLFGMSLVAFPRRFVGPYGTVKALYLVAFLVFVRYWVSAYRPSFLSQLKLFDPVVFATPMLGGLMRSPGDLLVTSIFFVVAVYGVLKITRDMPATGPEEKGNAGATPVIRGIVYAGILAIVYLLASRFVSSLVANANPRLLGETMRLFEPNTVVLHFSAFLVMAGIFLAGAIAMWGVGRRIRGGSVRVATVVVVAGSVVGAVWIGRWEYLLVAVPLLAFITLAPRVVQREDLVSIVMVAFGFVMIVSATAYVFLNDEYQGLRRSFIRERVAELTDPSDNWKVFILEDVLEEFSKDNTIRQVLSKPGAQDARRLAFDLWAGSSLSLLGYSSAIHVLDAADSVVSRFTVEMPYRVTLREPGERIEPTGQQEWVVLDLETETPRGRVRFYRGIVDIGDYVVQPQGGVGRSTVGRVVVDIPFFFESLSWAARTGRQTPELLRNVQEGGIEPRLEEPEALLLARLRGARVFESSSDVLPVGFAFPDALLERAVDLRWPLLRTAGPTYRILVRQLDGGAYFLAGFPVPSPLQHVLRWSAILSLYFFFAVVLIVVLVGLRGIPRLRPVLPSMTHSGRMGFQQKLLGSFLLIALFPAVFLGLFSIDLIRDRFLQENTKEALQKSFAAAKSLENGLLGELEYLLEQGDIHELVAGRVSGLFAGVGERVVVVFDENGMPVSREAPDGATRVDAAADPPGEGVKRSLPAFDVERILGRFPPEQMFVHEIDGRPYLAAISRRVRLLSDAGTDAYFIYYGQLLDEDRLGKVADAVGADVNIYDGGRLIASSRAGLLSGGFISAMMNAEAFVEVSLMDVDETVVTETAGRYRYEVAYLPIQSALHDANAAMGVPLLFRPESYHVEVQKATSIVLGIFALLSAATIGIGLLLARGIFGPLKHLLEGTRRIASGDLSFVLPTQRRDEIGTVMEAFNDMTRQLSVSQSALRERRRYLEVILASIGAGVISTDEADRVRAVNNAAERILGVRATEVTGRTTKEIVDAGLVSGFFSLLDRRGEHPPFVSSEVDLELHGQRRTIKYVQTEVRDGDRYMGTVMVFEDLTELISSKKLSAWVEMARQVAHEIKNPLTPIKLSTQFMMRAHQQGAPDFDRIFEESAGTVIKQVEVLRRIATEFSSFGRLQQLEVGSHDVVGLLRMIVEPYQRNASGVDVSFEAPEALYARVDPEALRKICTNLLENAMEAMPDGGRLDVECAAPNANGGRVAISFTDSGPGLSKDVQARLFEPYFSTKTTGTGLGLAICRSLSREMDGDVEVQNLDGGRGARATLHLKHVPAPDAA